MRPLLRTLVCFALVLVGLPIAPSASGATVPLASMTAPIYQVVNPTTQASLVTGWADERAAAASYGFTSDLGTPFKASLVAGAGLGPVRRFFNSSTGQFAWAVQASVQASTLSNAGFVEQQTDFFAATSEVAGQTQPVNGLRKGTARRLALASGTAALVAAGWSVEFTAFHVPGVVAPPPPPPPPPPPATTVGSAPIGTTSYTVPTNAVHVSPAGNDASSGAASAPVRTLGRALAIAPAGGTVVMRAGTYHQADVVVTKAVTIQAYPNEAVWLDGSEPVTGWVADGSAWRRDNWTVRFDHSPTYTPGAPDGPAPHWQFVNPSYPMAAHPDQVFVNGAALRQVASRSQVVAGTFFLDEATSRLYIGSNPVGADVAASTFIKALSIRAADVTLRGIGVRRYSPSVAHIGSVTLEAPRARVENVVVEDSATTGMSVQREDITLSRVTIQRSGMLGIHGRNADRVTFDGVLSTANNAERFNIAPVSGGAKLGATRGVTVKGSSFSGNYGHGFWEDMSVYNSVIVNSQFSNNAGTGLFLEISAKAVVASNVFSGNTEFGAKINNTSNVQVWNNTFFSNNRPLNLVQDSRRNTNPNDPAVDRRVPWPDPEMPWTLGGPLVVRNNVVASANTSANCLLCVEDYSFKTSAEQMGVDSNSNVYHRPSSSQPTWLAIWARGTIVNPYVFTTLAQLQATVGQERKGREYVGAAIIDAQGKLVPGVASVAPQVAEPLPSWLAPLIGQPAGVQALGRF